INAPLTLADTLLTNAARATGSPHLLHHRCHGEPPPALQSRIKRATPHRHPSGESLQRTPQASRLGHHARSHPSLAHPSPDVSLEKAMQFVKGNFSFRLNSKFPVWQS